MIDKNSYGPKLPISQEIHASKYRSKGETFYGYATRVAGALQDTPEHFKEFREQLLHQQFLPAGRVQSAMGSTRRVTAYNCFVMGPVPDSYSGIIDCLKEAGTTMRMGGGVGYDFSTIRPRGFIITSLDSQASGPVSFMDVFDSNCKTILSAGHRRGAQMGVLRVDHPDIEIFVRAKQNDTELRNFNISVWVTDEFMRAVEAGTEFALRFEGHIVKWIDARALWEEIMRSTWSWAEPGVLFGDRMNEMNNLYYCETIAATNPCGEQNLPPYGACLLGSQNLTKYLKVSAKGHISFDWDKYVRSFPAIIRAMDNVVDRTNYPLRQQELEAKDKRRMGIGVCGLANAGEILGLPYGSDEFLDFTDEVLHVLKTECYKASIMLAKEKGPFPLFDKGKYLGSKYIQTLDKEIQDGIALYGIRNSHLTSIAPTGTISLTADNVSSGLEPVFCHSYERTIQTFDGPRVELVTDFAFREFGVRGKTAQECSADDHLNVLLTAAKHIDSAISKTCNVSPDMAWEDFKDIYMKAWKGGAKGCTTFNPGGERFGVLNAVPSSEENEGAACYIDPTTGNKSCD